MYVGVNLNEPKISDLKEAITNITKLIQKNCMSLPSLQICHFDHIGLVEFKETSIKLQVLNYNGKIIKF